MPKTWRRKGFLGFPDLPRFLPSTSICLRRSPNLWITCRCLDSFILILFSVHENHCYRGLGLHNHLEMFPILFWIPIWFLALAIQVGSGHHTFPTIQTSEQVHTVSFLSMHGRKNWMLSSSLPFIFRHTSPFQKQSIDKMQNRLPCIEIHLKKSLFPVRKDDWFQVVLF